MKDFDYNEYLAGKKVVTEDGHDAVELFIIPDWILKNFAPTINMYSLSPGYPLAALMPDGRVRFYRIDGRLPYPGINLKMKPVTTTYYHFTYIDRFGCLCSSNPKNINSHNNLINEHKKSGYKIIKEYTTEVTD